MALLGYKDSIGEVSFKCGGSIISKRHVLTGLFFYRAKLTKLFDQLSFYSGALQTKQFVGIYEISSCKYFKFFQSIGAIG